MAKRKKKPRPAKKAEAAKKARTSDAPNPLTQKTRNTHSGKLFLTIALVIVLFLAYWRTSSRPLRSVLGTDRFTAVSAAASRTQGTAEGHWTLEAAAPDGDMAALLDILDSTRFRPDMGDLWLLHTDGAVYEAGPVRVRLDLLGEDGETRTVDYYREDTLLAGDKRFHPTDRTVLDRLASYMEEHGAAD